MRRHVAAYRFLLFTYPAGFRRAYGEEMTQLFADLLAGKRQSGQRFAALRLWSHTLVDTISSSTRERVEGSMFSQTGITRALLITFPIASIAVYSMMGLYLGLSVMAAGIVVLVLRRRSLPNAIVGARRGRWWTWTLAGAVMIVGSVVAAVLSGEFDEVRWIIFSLLFFAGVLMVAASIVRILVLMMRRPSAPPV